MVLLSACGKKGDYVHYLTTPPETKRFDSSYRIKELVGASAVDILWVIDNSASMSRWQTAVRQNTANFMKGFAAKPGLRWRMALISTDRHEDPYVGMAPGDSLDWTTTDPERVFRDAVARLGLDGDATERTFEPIEKALQRYPAYVRSDAALALISLTDAPEQSQMTSREFLDFLTRIKGDSHKVYTYGIWNAEDWGCSPTDDPFDYAGSPYEDWIKGTTGKTYKLCDGNFGNNLALLGADIGTKLSSPRLPLKVRPDIATLKVYYLDKELAAGPASEGGLWIYDPDTNSLIFHNLDFAPGDDEQVRVVYNQYGV